MVLRAVHEKELMAMGAPPHRVDSEHGGPSAGPQPGGEQHIPQPLPEAATGGTRMAIALIVAALVIIVLVVLL